MALFLFEVHRLCREYGFLAVLLALVGTGIAQGLIDPLDEPFTVSLTPAAVVWAASFRVAADLRSGRLDFMLSRGVALPYLVLVRFALGWLVGAVCVAVQLMPAAVFGHLTGLRVWEVAALITYWAAVGSLLGLFLSAAAALLLALATTALASWWAMGGCVLITHEAPWVMPWGVVSYALHALGNVLPASQFPTLMGRWVEAIRLPLAAGLVGAAYRWADRRDVLTREDG